VAASAQATIDLIFNGIDRTGAATQAALDNAQKFTGSLQGITAPIADFTIGAAKLEAGLLAAGAAMTVFAVKTAGDFDTAFRQITTLFEASEQDIESFKQAILSYASSSAKPLSDITSALSGAIGAGVDYKDSIELLGVAEKLAVATRADLTSTTETLVSTLNAYGMKTADAGVLADQFFQIIKDGKIEMKDLAASLANVTPLAATAGISMKEVGAAIATLTAAGVQPSQAIDGIQAAISNIIKPSKEAADLAAELGIQFDITALKTKGFSGVIEDVKNATGGSADKMSILFGRVNALSSVLTLTGPQADNFKAALVSMGDSAGSVEGAFKKMTDGIDVASQRVGNAFTTMLVQIGTPMLDEFGGVAKAIAKIFETLGASVKDGALGSMVEYIEGLFQDLQKTLDTVATNLPAALEGADLSGFKNGIDAVVSAFGRLFSGIDITTVDGLTRAIELAGAAFLGLSKFTAGVVDSFKPLFDKLVEIGGKVDGLGPDFFELAGNIGGVVTQFNLLLGGISGLIPWLETLVGLLVAKQGLSLLGGVQTLVTSLPGFTLALQAAGVAIAAYWASGKIVDLVKALNDWYAANGKLKESQEQGKSINEQAAVAMEKFTASTGLGVKSLDDMIRLQKDGVVVFDKSTNSYKLAGEAIGDAGDAAGKSVNPFEAANQAMLDNFAASEKAAGGVDKLADAQDKVNTYAYKTVPIFDAITGAITGYEQQLVKSADGTVKLGGAADNAGSSLAKITKETEKAEAAQRKWNEEVAKMKFEEKLKLIEQQTALMTASIDADAKKTVAAFDSISVSIKSTGEVLSSLFGLYKDYGSMDWSAIRAIEKQIDKENKFRDKAFDLQEKMTTAQIKSMEAQTNALNNGEGLIKITGDGLKPHLEAFMWEILQTIQVKVNADGLKMLLGT